MTTTTERIKEACLRCVTLDASGDDYYDRIGMLAAYGLEMAELLERAKVRAGMSIPYWKTWIEDFEKFQKGSDK